MLTPRAARLHHSASFFTSEAVRMQSTMMDRRRVMASLAASAALAPVQWASATTFRRAYPASELIAAARKQVGVTLGYDPSYTSIAFPGGDVPRSTGVCTDVLIRAFRDAFDVDLQELVHTDMRVAFPAYPQVWGLKRPDTNIDHRRVPNLQMFFKRRKEALHLPTQDGGWQPGDIFTSMINGKLPHIGIVSDRRSRSGRWAVIHNIGQGAREEDALQLHPLTGRYRFLLA